MKRLDFRSDTVSLPTPEMRQSMLHAEVGDDTMRDDPTVIALEEKCASLFGKEEAVFMASGTMANQVAVMLLTSRGEEVILGDTSHLYNLEVGGLAALSQVQAKCISATQRRYDPAEVEEAFRGNGIQLAKTSLLCLENAKDLNRGFAVPVDNLQEVADIAHRRGARVYMDGARILNAACALNVDVKDLVSMTDVCSLVFTKALGSPFGAVLMGSHELMQQARWLKQRLGGGFRQIGFMAAPALYALEHLVERIHIDHENAQVLAQGLNDLGLLDGTLEDIDISIVIGNCSKLKLSSQSFSEELKKYNLLIKPISENNFRMITHIGLEKEDVYDALNRIESAM
jgi:threonine aldolase